MQLAIDATSIIDVRAPAEYAKAHLPNSTNLPILTDDERHQVGLTYKQAGNQAATELGHKLVSGSVKQQRIDSWLAAVRETDTTQLMCWRGGARSRIAQEWLQAAGVDLHRIPGGYKARRQECLALLEHACNKPWWVLGGKTGVGKTVAIQQTNHSIDLEGLAQHRGSAFGSFPVNAAGEAHVQPAQATFENFLAYAAACHTGDQIVVEDESRMIGRTALPQSWHSHMQQSPVVLIEADLATRAEHIYQEYVAQPLHSGASADLLKTHLRDCLKRISRRLGGAKHQDIDQQLVAAFANQASHQAWITSLLRDYYDPMYEYQLAKKSSRIRFRGPLPEAVAFINQQTQS